MSPNNQLADRIEKAVYPAPDDASAMELVEIRSAISHLLYNRPYDAYSPDWLASLDAAMTLVPEGACWRVIAWPKNTAGPKAGALIEGAPDATGATPALALAAAALRSRSS